MKYNHLQPRLLIFSLLIFNGLYLCAQPDQPVIAYCIIQGAKQGTIKGGSQIKGKENQIECIGFSYSIQSPRDASTGTATGKLQHTPFVIVKHLDGATPQLLQAASTNEALKSVVIEFYRVAPNGKSTLYQSVQLINATISKVLQYGGTSSPEKMLPGSNPYEEISFTFQKIQINNPESKTTAIDDWTVN